VYRFERYANVVYRSDSPRSARRRGMIEQLLTRAEASLPQRGSLLDVGCSTGTLMAVASGRGWKVEGLERDRVTAEEARRRVGADVHCVETIGELPPDRSYDLVVMSHVLEHVRDPATALRQARGRLGPSGFVLIRVPNARSVASHSTGRLWPWFCPPIHLYYFDSESLAGLLTRTGFDLRGTWTWLGDANSVPIDIASAMIRLAVEATSRRRPSDPGPQRAIAVESPALRSARERVDERLLSSFAGRGDSELVVLAQAA
jgi:SAM-dependent methyltransferase